MKQYVVAQHIAVLLSLAALGWVHAEPARLGPLKIDSAYARATVAGQEVGAAYLTIENTGSTTDRLLAASSAAARSVVLHSSQMDGDMAKMHHEMALEIPAHSRVEMKPGGLHLMLEHLKHPLHEGDILSMTLKFEKSGATEISIPIKPILPDGEISTMHHDMTY